MIQTLVIPVLEVCPQAPPGAQVHIDSLTGYVLWGVLALFAIGVAIGIGSIVAGKIFQMPHASKGGGVGLAVIGLTAVAYVIVPPMIAAILGSGCVG